MSRLPSVLTFRRPDGSTCKSNNSIDRDRWLARGYTLVDETEPVLPTKLPEIVVEAGGEAADADAERYEVEDLDKYTKKQLADYCKENEIEYKATATKDELLELAKEFAEN